MGESGSLGVAEAFSYQVDNSLGVKGSRKSTATKAIPPNCCQVFPLFGGESGQRCAQQKELEVR